jgi:curli biogenesis system outer membrane secretion channel CsgG
MELGRRAGIIGIFETRGYLPEVCSMKKLLALTITLLVLAGLAPAATKESGSTTLTNVQPAGTTDKQHKKQQFDLTFSSSTNEYTCRSNENQKVQATQFVVGTTVSYKIDGNKGEVKSTASGKNVKCTLVRVAAVTPATM